ncbi:MAG: translesion error-prone DNA polymerase V autoproteolytic subunit [Bacteriovoracaceae bacterium]|nr:translesion error-prone DNA polymerase V autoproteolytic subunit [Bacteriovoracaceae bacterium]
MDALKLLPPSPQSSVPLVSSSVSCGFLSPAEDYHEGTLNLHEHLITRPSSTFFVRAQGDSMIGAGIFSGDLLIIDKSIEAKHGHIVVAIVNGEFMLKRFHKRNNEIWLHPENPKYSPMLMTMEMDFQVWGVAIHCIHKLLPSL